MAKIPTLSLVIPAFNEGKIIENTLKETIRILSTENYDWEIVVADDGSRDKTPDLVKKFKDRKVRLVQLPKNKGKGGALKEGILKTNGDYVIFMDADLSVPLTFIDVFLGKLKESNVVIASRRTEGAEIVVHQPFLRETMGRVFTFLTKLITGVGVSDFTCGFKGFTKTAALKIFSNSLIERWAYDAEILFLAKKYSYKIAEVPISWKNRIDTRVKLTNVVLETLRDLVIVRVNNIRGLYD